MHDSKVEVEALFSLIREKYGDRLTDEQLQEVKTNVVRIVETSMDLRKVKLSNWDEPFSVFKPYRRGGT